MKDEAFADWSEARLYSEMTRLKMHLKTIDNMDTPQMFALLFAHMGMDAGLIAFKSKTPFATLGLLEEVMQHSLDRTIRTAATVLRKHKLKDS